GAGALPPALAVVDPRRGAPRRAVAAGVLVAAAFALLGDFTIIAAVTDFAVYLVFVAVNATVVILRVRRPDVPRPFRGPGAIGRVPVAPVFGLVSVVVMLTQLEMLAILVGAALCAIGLTVGWLFRRR